MGEEISARGLVQIVREEVRKVVKEELANSDKRLQRALIEIILEGGTSKRERGEKRVITAGKG